MEARLGEPTVWEEVLWDSLLGSPDSFGTLDLVFQTPALVRAFYGGREGEDVLARVSDAVRAASAKAGGFPVILVGHSFGAAIAYEALARGLAPEAHSLVMLAAPMGLFNSPAAFAERIAAAKAPGLGALAGVFAPVAAHVAGFPRVAGGRLPKDFPALALRSNADWYAAPLGADFPDVRECEVSPPPGTRGGANHRFYWSSSAVAEWVAAASDLLR